MQEASENLIAKMVLVAVATALITILVFPPISYISFFLYGIPADFFIATAYVFWLVMRRTDRRIGQAFLVGFLPVVALFVFLVFRAKTSYGLMLILPIACVCVVHWRIRSRL